MSLDLLKKSTSPMTMLGGFSNLLQRFHSLLCVSLQRRQLRMPVRLSKADVFRSLRCASCSFLHGDDPQHGAYFGKQRDHRYRFVEKSSPPARMPCAKIFSSVTAARKMIDVHVDSPRRWVVCSASRIAQAIEMSCVSGRVASSRIGLCESRRNNCKASLPVDAPSGSIFRRQVISPGVQLIRFVSIVISEMPLCSVK